MPTAPLTIEKPVIAPATWVALIYVAAKELDTTNIDLLAGIRPTARPPSGRHFQAIAPVAPDHKIGTVVPCQSFYVHPGTNMGIHTRMGDDRETIERLPVALWDQVLLKSSDRRLVSIGAIEVLVPANPDDNGEPAYRHFSDEDALRLVAFHTHESWVDRALVGESRPAIKTAAEAQKIQILSNRRKLQEGQ